MRKWIFKLNVVLACICAALVITSAALLQTTLMIVLACIIVFCAIVSVTVYAKHIAGQADR